MCGTATALLCPLFRIPGDKERTPQYVRRSDVKRLPCASVRVVFCRGHGRWPTANYLVKFLIFRGTD
jgi:hypothetical protein